MKNTPTPNNPLVIEELVQQYDEQFMGDLEAVYPDQEEREIVETVIIPHFRTELAKTIQAFNAGRKLPIDSTLTPQEVPELCKAIEVMIEENRELLFADTYFKEGLKAINQNRQEAQETLNEAFYQDCRDILAGYGITSKKCLMNKGAKWFTRADFGLYGKGSRFAGMLLGFSVDVITIELLERVVDVIGLKDQDEKKEEMAEDDYRRLLAERGVVDKVTLLRKGQTWFLKEDFAPYGKGHRFASLVLGRTIRSIKLSVMAEVAEKLKLPEKLVDEEIEKERVQLFKSALLVHKISDRQSLVNFGPVKFAATRFGDYGKGKAFAREILGETVGQGQLKLAVLYKIADKLSWTEEGPEDMKTRYLKALEAHEIYDTRSMLKRGAEWFTTSEADFPPFGKGRAFFGRILGRSIKGINKRILLEVAEKIDMVELSDTSIGLYREVLERLGVRDRATLLKKGGAWFVRQDFAPYGKARAFAGSILGRTVGNIVSKTLSEIADELKLPAVDEKERSEMMQEYYSALAKYGIVDRASLLVKGASWFNLKADFSPYGRGRAFAAKILGRTIASVSRAVFIEIADILFPEEG